MPACLHVLKFIVNLSNGEKQQGRKEVERIRRVVRGMVLGEGRGGGRKIVLTARHRAGRMTMKSRVRVCVRKRAGTTC